MKWILLALVLPFSGSYVGITAEFNSQKACQYAGEQLKSAGYARTSGYICVPKGEESK